MKRALIAAGLLLGLGLVAAPAQAQTGTARGRVLDAQGQPVVDAKVTIEFQGGITRKFETKTQQEGRVHAGGDAARPLPLHGHQGGLPARRHRVPHHPRRPDRDPRLQAEHPGAGRASSRGAPQAELRESFQKAVELQSAGKLDEAEAAYKAILEKTPDVPEVYQNLGSVLAQKKDFAAAEAAFLKGLELRPDSADIATQLARLYQDNGQPEKAMALMTKSAGANPADAKAQFNQGIFLLNAQQERGSDRRVRGRDQGRPRHDRGVLPARGADGGPGQDPRGDRPPREVPQHEPHRRRRTSRRPRGCSRP